MLLYHLAKVKKILNGSQKALFDYCISNSYGTRIIFYFHGVCIKSSDFTKTLWTEIARPKFITSILRERASETSYLLCSCSLCLRNSEAFVLESIMIAILIFVVVHWYLSLFIQTFFHHRYASHGQFTMSPFWEKFFYVLTWIAQGSSYLSPRAYALLHRMHHAYADEEHDPHSPKHFSNALSMIWDTKETYRKIWTGETEVDEKFCKNVPRWDAFERVAHSWVSKACWIALYTGFYVYFAPSWWFFLILPFHYLQAAIHGVIINWGAHKYGYRNYKVKDTSTNLFPWDFLMMGEGLHNNHHKHASSPNFASKWWEFDPSYLVIKLLSLLGIIQIKRA